MRAVVVEPGRPAVVRDIDSSLRGLQHLVGGYIEFVYPFDDRAAIVCNDEGKINGFPMNRALRDENGDVYDVISGTFAVVGLTEGDVGACDLSPEQEAVYLEMYKTPEKFMIRNGDLMIVSAVPKGNGGGFNGYL